MKILIFILISGLALSADLFSFKDFTGKKSVDIPDGSTVIGSCFAQEVIKTPDGWAPVHIFRENMTGVKFERCNLDNVFIPPGNTVDASCTSRKLASCEDIDGVKDWILDNSKNAVEPIDKDRLIVKGKNIDPAKIKKAVVVEGAVEGMKIE